MNKDDNKECVVDELVFAICTKVGKRSNGYNSTCVHSNRARLRVCARSHGTCTLQLDSQVAAELRVGDHVILGSNTGEALKQPTLKRAKKVKQSGPPWSVHLVQEDYEEPEDSRWVRRVCPWLRSAVSTCAQNYTRLLSSLTSLWTP